MLAFRSYSLYFLREIPKGFSYKLATYPATTDDSRNCCISSDFKNRSEILLLEDKSDETIQISRRATRRWNLQCFEVFC